MSLLALNYTQKKKEKISIITLFSLSVYLHLICKWNFRNLVSYLIALSKSKLSIVNLTNLKSLIDLVWKTVMFFSNWELPCLLLLVQEENFFNYIFLKNYTKIGVLVHYLVLEWQKKKWFSFIVYHFPIGGKIVTSWKNDHKFVSWNNMKEKYYHQMLKYFWKLIYVVFLH